MLRQDTKNLAALRRFLPTGLLLARVAAVAAGSLQQAPKQRSRGCCPLVSFAKMPCGYCRCIAINWGEGENASVFRPCHFLVCSGRNNGAFFPRIREKTRSIHKWLCENTIRFAENGENEALMVSQRRRPDCAVRIVTGRFKRGRGDNRRQPE